MDSILDLPSVRERLSRTSVEEYHRQPDYNGNGKRTELIRGFVVEKMSKTPLHGTISSTLQELIMRGVPEGFVWRREEPLTFHDSEPEPDISIVHGTRRDFLRSHPRTAALAVEVSVRSVAEDRAKAALYAEAMVEEYWIVLPAQKTVEVYRRPEEGSYREMREYRIGEVVDCAAVVGVRVALAELFADL
jgi:Uma2 family endonuclease